VSPSLPLSAEAASAPPERKRIRDPNRARRILDAAQTLFYERGFHAVSVDEIGEAAGATGAAIYRYFSGKEDILATLFDEAQDRYLLAIPEQSEDPLEAMRELVTRHLTITLEQRELGAIWAHEHRALSAEHARRVNRRSRKYLSEWTETLGRAFPHRNEEDLLTAADAAIGTTTSLIARPGRPIRDTETAVVRKMIIAGLMSLAEPVD
jgi:AcrR family transcriptional regulator